MADGYVSVREGEQVYLFFSLPATSGTGLISSGWTWTLFDQAGAALAGRMNITGDGQDGAAASPRAWAKLDTRAAGSPPPAALAAGYYNAVATLAVTGSDGLVRVEKPVIEVHVMDSRL